MSGQVKEIHTEKIQLNDCANHLTADGVRRVDCINQPCPLPLMETRKAVMKGKKGDVIQISGTHPNSKFEIPMALESMKCEVQEITQSGDVWTITFKI